MVTSNELKSVDGIIYRKEHLKQNIHSIKYGGYKMFRSSNGDQKYSHILQLKLFVRTGRLRETPQLYAWRHLGQDSWTLQDGTQITMNRIHMKG